MCQLGLIMDKNIKPKKKISLVKRTESKHKFNSFFAGIGGFDLGFEKIGITPAYHCEINEFCNSVLRRHWPDVPCDKDIREVKHNDLPEADIWCGGFPCQDVSIARSWRGRDGLKGKNSGLFYPFLELISKKKPKVVILENVMGLLNSHNGEDFKVILESLTSNGYAVAWRVLNARYFGSPQSRPRVFISACRGSLELAIKNLYEDEISKTPPNARKGFLTPSICSKTKAIVPQVAYCLAATSGRHTGTDWSRSYVSYHDKVRRMTPTECEGLQSFPVGWSYPDNDFHRSDDEIDTLRYHALGNAVSVSVVKWIGERIVNNMDDKTIASTKGRFTDKRLLKIAGNASCVFDVKGRVKTFSELNNEESVRWKSGGCAFKDYVMDLAVSPSPVKPISSKFINVIERREVEGKYYISSNAAEGILRRVNGQGRTLFGPLSDALYRLSGIHNPDIDELEQIIEKCG